MFCPTRLACCQVKTCPWPDKWPAYRGKKIYLKPWIMTWQCNWPVDQSGQQPDIITIHRRYNITLTLKVTTAQVVEMSVTVTNSSFQNYTHPDDHTRQTTETSLRSENCVPLGWGSLYILTVTFRWASFTFAFSQETNPIVRTDIPWNKSFNARGRRHNSFAVLVVVFVEQRTVFCSWQRVLWGRR